MNARRQVHGQGPTLAVRPPEAPYVVPGRCAGRKLDQFVVQEGSPALYRRSHAHLILLHQEFNQIRLDVEIEKPVEEILALRAEGEELRRIRIRINFLDFLPEPSRQ